MGFRDNLRKKIHIHRLTDKVMRSINPSDSTQRIDSAAMKELLDLGTYPQKKERDLDLYMFNNGHILVLDNELKIYNTTAEDIGLRKSPTVKEMISIRNAIKILNDKKVVVSRKATTVERVSRELIDDLDLSFEKADIASMVEDGHDALKNNDSQGVVEILTLFAELVQYDNAPRALRMPHHHIWGRTTLSNGGERRFGPGIIYGLMHNKLQMFKKPINTQSENQVREFHQMVKGERDADLSNTAVLEALQEAVLNTQQTVE